ncbi:hypothetical protein SAMN06265337_0647 [Hymenobacter gelipurpurascens]|uniref:Uncharacterized protein n=1 Tax=Hymenobacter gelipurpurascens TaxID=89968 RepID=A0A212T950_9BACT|nr:hypothetical protein [Hymenobacter gelipurpurascens]SNC62324.1 hypothetical protein SAMN06265337_0647 [Hymenobacter gelipurpurascens]
MKRITYSFALAVMLFGVSSALEAAPVSKINTVKVALPIGYTLGFRDGKAFAQRTGQNEIEMDRAYNEAYANWEYYLSVGEDGQAEFWHGYVDGLNWIPDSGSPIIP